MKALEKILIAILALSILFVGIAYLLPAQWQVSRMVTINAPPSAIHPYVENFKKWAEWAPWNSEMDPSIRYEYFGPEAGEGAGESWNGNKSGSGKMTITKSDPMTGITYSLQFGGEKQPSSGSIRYEVVSAGTNVIWTSSGDLGNNPISRYFGLFMNSMIGTDFEKGLAKLKKTVEHGA